jgi:hypothetical protein
MVRGFGLFTQPVRAVREHDRGNAGPPVALGVPEIRTAEQGGLPLQGKIGEHGGQVDGGHKFMITEIPRAHSTLSFRLGKSFRDLMLLIFPNGRGLLPRRPLQFPEVRAGHAIPPATRIYRTRVW